jgi:hypothetical protein
MADIRTLCRAFTHFFAEAACLDLVLLMLCSYQKCSGSRKNIGRQALFKLMHAHDQRCLLQRWLSAASVIASRTSCFLVNVAFALQ